MQDRLRNMPQHELNLSLIMIAQVGDRREVELLLEYGAQVNTKERLKNFNEQGDTPLIVAALAGHNAVVDLLLQGGAQINIPNADGATALHAAVIGGHPRIVELFIKNGADIFIRSGDGTAIDSAVHERSEEMLNLLLTGISQEDEEAIEENLELLVILNRMYIKDKLDGGMELGFQQLRPGHATCTPDLRLKKVRQLITKHFVRDLVIERLERVEEILPIGGSTFGSTQAQLEPKIKHILFGNPVPKRLPEFTREENDPFGSWLLNDKNIK